MASTTLLEHRIVRASSSILLREIDDLFIFGGADPEWRGPPPAAWNNREDGARAWIGGIKRHAPDQLRSILINVLHQIGGEIDESSGATAAGGATEPSSGEAGLHLMPASIAVLLDVLTRGIPRAAFPLARRRSGKTPLTLTDEYDVHDLFHSLLRPWVKDIRAEEYPPSYALRSARIDFLLPKHQVAIEIKCVRDRSHGKKVHQELAIDIAQYMKHQDTHLWAIVFDPGGHISNPEALGDVVGHHQTNARSLDLTCYVVGTQGADRVGGGASYAMQPRRIIEAI